jgi:hypothetical protein
MSWERIVGFVVTILANSANSWRMNAGTQLNKQLFLKIKTHVASTELGSGGEIGLDFWPFDDFNTMLDV